MARSPQAITTSTAPDSSRRRPTTLRIEPLFHLGLVGQANFNGLPCAPLCSVGSIFPYYNPEGGWPVQALVALTWRYTTAAGQVVQADGPAIADRRVAAITLISLSTRWSERRLANANADI